MEQDNKINSEVVEGQIVSESQTELTAHRGRPSIEEDDDLKIKYIQIHRLKVTNPNISLKKIAYAAGVSVGTVKNAIRYVRKNYEMLGTQEGLADSTALLDARIGEANKHLEVVEKGTPILMPDGTALVDAQGQAIFKINYDLILRLRRDRREYEILKLDLMGMMGKTESIVGGTTIMGNVNIVQANLVDKMSKEDKDRYLEMLDRYSEPPDGDS